MLDLVLLLILMLYAARGARRGFVVTALSLLGLVLGAGLALWLGPIGLAQLPDIAANPPLRAVLLLVGVLIGAILGEGLVGGVGRRLRAATRAQPLRLLDSLAGAVAGSVVCAVVLWMIATAAQPIAPRSWARELDRSRVLTAIDAAVPPQASRWTTTLTDALDASGFPQVFSGLGAEPSIAAPPPDAGVIRSDGVRRAAASIVRIDAQALQCGRQQEGSGWVSSAQRVVTNAHVVAGSNAVTVQVGGRGTRYPAEVVSFNPDLDLAVLAVPELDAAPLRRSGPLSARSNVVVAGFPLGGPYQLDAARVRGTISATGADIYGGRGVTRQVYGLRGQVAPGNSGGPLLTSDGRVAGTIFARSTTDAATGYALTNAATNQMVAAGATDTTPASTQACSAA